MKGVKGLLSRLNTVYGHYVALVNRAKILISLIDEYINFLQFSFAALWANLRLSAGEDVKIQSGGFFRYMNVLQLVCCTGFYGAERWVMALANNLDSTNVKCDLLAVSENPDERIELLDLYPEKVGNALRVEMNNRFDISVVRKIAFLIKEREIDIIHSHGYKSDILGLIAAKLAGIKCVSTPHGFGDKVGIKLRIFNKLGTYAFHFMDYVVPLSQQIYDQVISFNVNPDKVVLILNGVDLTELEKYVPSENVTEVDPPPARNNGKNIGFVGRLTPGKEIHEILHSFDVIWKKDRSLQLTLVGDGEQRSELTSIAESQASSNNITFLGFRDDRLELMKDFDLFVMTSSSEGIPRCLMEALAIEIPVVAYNIPGVNQLVIHGETGLLADFGNRKQLAEHLVTLLTNRKLAQKLGTTGREHVIRKFSAARMAEDYSNLYARLLVQTDQAEI